MLVAKYKTKTELKASVGKVFQYEETSVHGEEYKGPGTYAVVGPDVHNRKWFAQVTTDYARLIQKVR